MRVHDFRRNLPRTCSCSRSQTERSRFDGIPLIYYAGAQRLFLPHRTVFRRFVTHGYKEFETRADARQIGIDIAFDEIRKISSTIASFDAEFLIRSHNPMGEKISSSATDRG